MANWFHKHERGRVMGVWCDELHRRLARVGLRARPGARRSAAPATQPWEWCFYVGAMVLACVWIQFYFLQRNEPEDVGLARDRRSR